MNSTTLLSCSNTGLLISNLGLFLLYGTASYNTRNNNTYSEKATQEQDQDRLLLSTHLLFCLLMVVAVPAPLTELMTLTPALEQTGNFGQMDPFIHPLSFPPCVFVHIFHLSVLLLTHSSFLPSFVFPFIFPSVHCSFYALIYPSFLTSILSVSHPSFYPPTHPSIRPSFHTSIPSSIHLPVIHPPLPSLSTILASFRSFTTFSPNKCWLNLYGIGCWAVIAVNKAGPSIHGA